VDVASAFFGNSEVLQMYGNVLNADLSEILESFLYKFINGEALNLYNNEIKGVEAVDWKKFPKALIISDDRLKCEPVADKLTELNSLVDFISQ
jgi:para-nitrobenzyl esterase